jgi:two-component system NtrC family sensor kinase
LTRFRRKEAAESAHHELLATQRQLLEAEKLATLGTLASGVAHEINNPLAFAIGGVEQLQRSIRELTDDLPGEAPRDRRAVLAEVQEIHQEVRAGLERIRAIVQNLMLLAGSRQTPAAPLDVNAEIERAIAIVQSQLQGIELRRSFQGAPSIQAMPGYITQIVTHLLTNAADAVAAVPQPRIEIAAGPLDGGAEIVVQDNGVGIAPHVLPHVFDPFFTTKPAGKGAGLGLCVCHALVRRLGGSASVSSKPHSGARIRIWLPRDARGADAHHESARAAVLS